MTRYSTADVITVTGPQDWDAFHALLTRAFAGMEGRIDPPSSLHRMTPADIERQARDHLLLAIVEGGVPIGSLSVTVEPDCLYLGKLATDAGHLRQGIARALIERAAELAPTLDRDLLRLQTRIELTGNHATFAALGFEKTAETAHPGFDRPTSITMERRAMAQTTGHCHCGAVRWAYTAGVETWACHCHCADCRRNCAAPVTSFVGVPLAQFAWTGQPAATYASSPGVTRHFCGTCGTPMAFQAEHYAGEIHLYAATLTWPRLFRPAFHVHYDSRLPWLHMDDGLPKHPGSAPADQS